MSDPFLEDVDESPLPSEESGLESILHHLMDVVASAKSMPLSSSVMVSREEVTGLVQSALDSLPEELRQANAVAQRILDDANEEARTLRHQAEDFVDTKLAGMEIVLDRLTRTVQAGRAKLAAPLVAPVEEPGARAEEDGFFDQDQP